jgi:hypothetical protein
MRVTCGPRRVIDRRVLAWWAVRDLVHGRSEGSEQVPSYFDQTPPTPPRQGEWTWPHRPAPEASTPSINPLLLHRTHQESVTFMRAIDTQFEAAAAALHKWWQQEACTGVLDVGRSRLLGDPYPLRGRCRVEVHLGRGFARRALPMELELVPWYPSYGTILLLCPTSHVKPGRRYFRNGHALIDAVIAAVV